MCLIVHKPAGRPLPAALLRSAAQFNPHGVGFIALPATEAAVVRRSVETDIDEILGWSAAHAADECVIHFRYRTRGEIDLTNTHPMPLSSHLHLFHNGTLAVERHTPQHSDTWHLASDFLAPVLTKRPALMTDPTFQRMLAAAVGRQNRLVLVDTQRRQVVIINRHEGIDSHGLWLSNTRWFDPRVLGHARPRGARAVEGPARAVSFLS